MSEEQSEYVTLISSDGYSFIVQRSSACISGAIKRMLDPSCTLKQFHSPNHKCISS
jgi:transcription elongation factor B subunit 1